jgi:hypothetical protein
MNIQFDEKSFPFTGRVAPNGAKLEIHNVHGNWGDLVWWHEERQVWIYLSTLPL